VDATQFVTRSFYGVKSMHSHINRRHGYDRNKVRKHTKKSGKYGRSQNDKPYLTNNLLHSNLWYMYIQWRISLALEA